MWLFAGYGNISPATRGGKTFAVFFAIVTIPVCLVMLAGIGAKLGEQAKKLEEKLEKIDSCAKHPKLGKALRYIIEFQVKATGTLWNQNFV